MVAVAASLLSKRWIAAAEAEQKTTRTEEEDDDSYGEGSEDMVFWLAFVVYVAWMAVLVAGGGSAGLPCVMTLQSAKWKEFA